MGFWETNFVMSYVIAVLLLVNFPVTLLAALPSNTSLGSLNTLELYKVAAVLLVYSLFCALLPVTRREAERRIKEYKRHRELHSSSMPFLLNYTQRYKKKQVFLLYLIPVSLLLIRFDLIEVYLTLLPVLLQSVLAIPLFRYLVYITLSFLIIPIVKQLLLILCHIISVFFVDSEDIYVD